MVVVVPAAQTGDKNSHSVVIIYLSTQQQRVHLLSFGLSPPSWWTIAKHLCWSLLGIAELEALDSVDSATETLAHLLYGIFLVVGVILLVNMMIALLSNTYQRVEVRNLKLLFDFNLYCRGSVAQ